VWRLPEDAEEDDGCSKVWSWALPKLWAGDECVLWDARRRASTVGSHAFDRRADGSKYSEAQFAAEAPGSKRMCGMAK